ncbi:hypothetical protein P8Q88_05850 [Qipengyuania sp. XHP0207]|uniref:hypothetical protein n=1 Tax=Qipengyuania sp. XHP0207 TaxID=3038078 RepID=UPI00241FF809|nr:hypothetical protein [Qipengyuania sp. XHP0207]MDG5747697.1 hypothetical protein [Qipengyuania sp. XHP0207]
MRGHGPRCTRTIPALSYWVSVECAAALGNWDPEKWSALTWTRWHCGDPEVGPYASGTYRRTTIDGKESFSIDFADSDSRHICHLDGRGVVFRTRDFEKWRKHDKDAAPRSSSAQFDYADPDHLGLAPGERPFLTELDGRSAQGLLDNANSMPPDHPWLDGSGDHVNSAHLAEVARQFVSLMREGRPFRVTGAEMSFRHYVELGAPLTIAGSAGDDGTVEMTVRQGGHECTEIRYSVVEI